MRLNWIVASAAALLFAGSNAQPAAAESTTGVMPAVASVTMITQATQSQPPQNVNVDIGVDDGTAWYANPVWIALGLLAIVVVGLVIGMAARGGGGNGSTIVK
jgi:hypothetical protein